MIKKSTEKSEYHKDFAGWAKFAEQVERRPRPTGLKSGIICWCYLGVNIGTEQDGRGDNFTRPVLILNILSPTQVIILPFTSKRKEGKSYMEIPINGQLESLIMNQPRTVDLRRIGDFLDEISGQELDKIRKIVVGLILRKNIKNSKARG